MKKSKISELLIEFVGLTLGCLSMSIGINMFFKPYTIAPGGLSGLSVVLNKLTGLSISMIMLIIGIPLILLSVKILGKKDAIKTFIGMIVLSTALSITAPVSNLLVTNDTLLCAISGAILVGLGLGVIFRVDASTGGTDLIALMLNRTFPNISISKFMIMLDGIVVISSGIANKNLETALYSGIALYIIAKLVDGIISGFDYSKSFMIISNKPEILRDAIMNDVKRGVTFLEGKGGYTDQQKNVLLVVVSQKQEVHLKKLIREVDPSAFIIVSNVHEVLGEGFKAISA